MLRRFVLLLAFASTTVFAAFPHDHAIFGDGFDPPVIAPQFQRVGGAWVIPTDPAAGSASSQLRWLMSELAAGQTTSTAEIAAHFTSAFNAADTASFIGAIRTDYPDARIVDLIHLGPYAAEVVIRGSGSIQAGYYMAISTQYTGDKKIGWFSTFNLPTYSVIRSADAGLTMAQAGTKIAALSDKASILVARINASDQCVPILDVNASEQRSTASIIKEWVLYGVARSIRDGEFHADDTMPLATNLFAAGGYLNNEVPNTPIPVLDLGRMMMGYSDNTATDMLGSLVGRANLDAAVTAAGHSTPLAIQPFLSMSEGFHLAWSFPTATTNGYLMGSEGYQQQFLTTNIAPRGNFSDTTPRPYFTPTVFSRGAWTASPYDVCKVLAKLRRLPQNSEAMRMVDASLSATSFLPDIRNHWDRVWYKEGQFYDGNGNNWVYNNAWLVENAGEEPYVFIALLNDDAAAISDAEIGSAQSLNARIMKILETQHP